MTRPTPIPAGFVHVVMTCPRCHQRQDVGLWLGTKLVVTEEDSALVPVMKSKGIDHKCGQFRMDDPPEPALPFDPPDPPAPRDDQADDDAIRAAALDYQQRAAGEGTRSA